MGGLAPMIGFPGGGSVPVRLDAAGGWLVCDGACRLPQLTSSSTAIINPSHRRMVLSPFALGDALWAIIPAWGEIAAGTIIGSWAHDGPDGGSWFGGQGSGAPCRSPADWSMGNFCAILG